MYKATKYQWSSNYFSIQSTIVSKEFSSSIKINSLKEQILIKSPANIHISYTEKNNNFLCVHYDNEDNILFYYNYESSIMPRCMLIEKLKYEFAFIKIDFNITLVKFPDNQVVYIYKKANYTRVVHMGSGKDLAHWIRKNSNLPKELDCVLTNLI
jgi:hypothetical protein